MKGLFHQMVSLHQLGCRKAYRYAGSLCMVLNKVHDTVKGPVHSPLMVIGTAEIPNARLFPVPCHMDCMAHQLLHPLVLAAEIGITGICRISSISLIRMEPPFFSTSSITLRASTMGTSSSMSCMVRYRFRSRFVASTILIMALGFSSRINFRDTISSLV